MFSMIGSRASLETPILGLKRVDYFCPSRLILFSGDLAVHNRYVSLLGLYLGLVMVVTRRQVELRGVQGEYTPTSRAAMGMNGVGLHCLTQINIYF